MKNFNYYILLISFSILTFGNLSVNAQEICSPVSIPDGKIDIEASTIFDAVTGMPPGGVSLDFGAALLGTFEQKTDGTVYGEMDWFFSTLPPPGTKPGSQVVSYWTLKENKNTKIQVTNNSTSDPVEVHVVILDENCIELRNFCDEFTPNDTHNYDLRNLFSNVGSNISTGGLDNREGILHITATDNCDFVFPNLPAIGFSQLNSSVTITDSANTVDYKFNGFNRDAVTSGCSLSTTDGHPILDGTMNCRLVRAPIFTGGSGQLQQINLTKSFTTLPGTIASRSDLVIINFEDNYQFGGSEYRSTPANADIVPFIFDKIENEFSCSTFGNACMTRLGINSSIPRSENDSDLDGVLDVDDNCPDTPNPLQSDIDVDGAGDLCDDCPADPTDSCDPMGSDAKEIDPAIGGTIMTPDGMISLDIEPGELLTEETISITEIMPGDSEVDLILGPNTGLGLRVASYDLKPDDLVFNPSATLTIVADVSALNATQQMNLDLYFFDDTLSAFVSLGAVCTILEVPLGTFIATCIAEIFHFTDFSLVTLLDSDGDGVPDDFLGVKDNCPNIVNPGQEETTDNDGVGDACDECLESDLSELVIVDHCDSGVDNFLAENGCTISDDIMECADGAKNHGKFVSCVSKLTNGLKKDGLISGKEKGKIQKCAAQSDLP